MPKKIMGRQKPIPIVRKIKKMVKLVCERANAAAPPRRGTEQALPSITATKPIKNDEVVPFFRKPLFVRFGSVRILRKTKANTKIIVAVKRV